MNYLAVYSVILGILVLLFLVVAIDAAIDCWDDRYSKKEFWLFGDKSPYLAAGWIHTGPLTMRQAKKAGRRWRRKYRNSEVTIAYLPMPENVYPAAEWR